MKDNVFFHSKCTNRNFTWDEWMEYCQTNGYSNGVVHTYKEFKYNIHDICLNPRTPIKWACKNVRFEINVAQSDNGRWACGIDFMTPHSGCGEGTGFIDDASKGFSTEKEAVYEGLAYIHRRCEEEIQYVKDYGFCSYVNDEVENSGSSILPLLAKAKKQLEAYMEEYDPRQLGLFGW